MFTLGDCLFRTVMLNKNSGAVKPGYSVYGMGFDVCSQFLLNGEWSKNVIIFAVDNNLLLHGDDRKKTHSFLVKSLDSTTMKTAK